MAKILGSHIPFEQKNLAINGALDFWQRVESATTTVNTATPTSFYTADMLISATSGSTTKNFSIVQSSTVPTLAQSGFTSQFSALFTMITGIPSFAATDLLQPFSIPMEGYDYARIHGKTVTFGFWFQAYSAGTYSFSLSSGTIARYFVTSFTVSLANTWQFISLTVTMDSASGWNFSNGKALNISIAPYSGSNNQTSTLNTWGASTAFVATGSTNLMASSSATMYLAQFSIVEGPLGFGSVGFLRAGKTIAHELALCQRYYEKSYAPGTAPGTATNADCIEFNSQGVNSDQRWWPFKVTKRVAATTTPYSANSGASGKAFDINASADVTWAAENAGFNGSGWQSGLTGGHILRFHYTADAGL